MSRQYIFCNGTNRLYEPMCSQYLHESGFDCIRYLSKRWPVMPVILCAHSQWKVCKLGSHLQTFLSVLFSAWTVTIKGLWAISSHGSIQPSLNSPSCQPALHSASFSCPDVQLWYTGRREQVLLPWNVYV